MIEYLHECVSLYTTAWRRNLCFDCSRYDLRRMFIVRRLEYLERLAILEEW